MEIVRSSERQVICYFATSFEEGENVVSEKAACFFEVSVKKT